MLVRAITAVILLAAFVAALLLLDEAGFSLVVAAVVAIAAYEWARLTGAKLPLALVYAAACVMIGQGVAQHPALIDAALLVALGLWAVVVPVWLARGFFPSWMALVGVVVLVPAAVAMVALSRQQLLLILGVVWIADTAAYLCGRAFGRRKLAPAISPGKTWEGVIGAGVACLIYAIICAMSVPSLRAQVQGAVWVLYLLGAALLCAASIVGDLFESAVKRKAGAKDSGAILPGHGGVLDRIDGITAALPLGALLVRQLGAA